MSSETINLKETYILEENKDEFFNSLVKNSETYLSMRAIDHLNRYGLELPQEAKKELTTFLDERSISMDEKKKIEFRQALLSLEKETEPEARKRILSKISGEFLPLSFFHQKPSNVKESKNLNSFGSFKHSSKVSDTLETRGSFDEVIKNFFNSPPRTLTTGLKSEAIQRVDLQRLLDTKIEFFREAIS